MKRKYLRNTLEKIGLALTTIISLVCMLACLHYEATSFVVISAFLVLTSCVLYVWACVQEIEIEEELKGEIKK